MLQTMIRKMKENLSLFITVFFISLAVLLSLTKARICHDESIFQRSLDWGGIYFKVLPIGTCRYANKSDIQFWVQKPGASAKSKPRFINIEDNDETLGKYFNPELPTAVYIHGFFEGPMSSSLRAIRTGYLLRKDHNFLAVNWQPLASAPWYPMAVIYYPQVAEATAQILQRLLDAKLINLDNLHMMGFSLGAHVCAATSKKLKSGRVARITAFDPALPLMSFISDDLKLDNSSAKFVDVIHTCGGIYGMVHPIGHIDFYPNGGSYIQPGCWTSFTPAICSHWRSWRFYAESLLGGEFHATSCDNYEHFTKGKCKNNQNILMGIDTNLTARGTYYLTTNWDSPYAL